MSRPSRRPNGHHQIPIGAGSVPIIGHNQHQTMAQPTPEQRKMAILAQMQAMMDEMFIRAASRLISEGVASSEPFQQLARQCHTAAEGYFAGLGIIELDPPENASDTPTEPAGEQA